MNSIIIKHADNDLCRCLNDMQCMAQTADCNVLSEACGHVYYIHHHHNHVLEINLCHHYYYHYIV